MPYLVEVRLNGHTPSQYNRIKVCFINPFLEEDRPLKQVRSDINANFSPCVLSDGKEGFPEVITVVGDEGKLELFSILY